MKTRPIYPDLANDANEQVSTALVLAAGTGSRLSPLTDMMPKCLVPVNKISILERLIHALQAHNFILVEPGELALNLGPMQQVVLRLLDYRLAQMVREIN